MILFVAPYSPVGSPAPKLGAARKIENIISALHEVDSNILLVNTAHNFEEDKEISLKHLNISGVEVASITPKTYKKRIVGKFLNIYQKNIICEKILSFGVPDVVWAYNGYALESRIAKYFAINHKSKYIIEFEDWIFSRSRGLNPKPLFDYLYWRDAFRYCNYAFCVSSGIVDRVGLSVGPGNFSEFPGLISQDIEVMNLSTPDGSGKFLVGYFGGLNSEKGADVLLAALKSNSIPSGFKFCICGSGALYKDFADLHKISPEYFDLYTNLNSAELLERMAECDVLINPHKVSKGYIEGLFPSKVIEYIGTGRVILSTELPRLYNGDILSAVKYFNGTVDDMFDALNDFASSVAEMSAASHKAAILARSIYGYTAFVRKIKDIISR